jgi:hypothetical protein
MRLVSALLFVALTGSAVAADDTKPADPKPEATKKKVPYRVVKMLPETGQVLLYDKHHGTYVVAEVGQGLDGYLVDDIDDEEVTLLADNGAVVVLTAPSAQVPKRVKPKAAPVDPYADGGPPAAAPSTEGEVSAEAPAGAAGGPVDPYTDPALPAVTGEGGVRVAAAPSGSAGAEASVRTASPVRDPHSLGPIAGAPIVEVGGPDTPADPYGDPGIAAFAAAVGAEPPAPGPATATTKGAQPAKKGKAKAAPAPAPDTASALAAAATGDEVPGPAAARPAAAVAPGTKVIARAELDAALADFTRTAGTFHATFTADGLRLDSISEGSLLAKAGLRRGDIVTYVDGRPLRSLDDAAGLYARAGSLRATTVQVAREGKLVTLHVAFQ